MRGWRGGIWTIALGVVAACTSSPTAVEVDRLKGRWEWVSASGGIAGRTLTPATEGYTMELRFLDGVAQVWRNGALGGEAGYEVAVGRQGGSFAGHDVIRFTPALFGWEEMGVELESGDRLLLADGCCDGYAYRFVRIGSAP